ncbi:MAG: hypothetical protein ACXVNO_04175 [Bacteroidia bacterium]
MHIKIKTNTMTKFALALLTVILLFTSWKALSPNNTPEERKQSPDYTDSLQPFIIRSHLKIRPLEKTDVIVLHDGNKIPGKATEVRVMEIKYLDSKNTMPIKILSIKRY